MLDLNKAVRNALDSLRAHEAMTVAMHIKMIAIAVLIGLLMGIMTFYFLTRKIDNLHYNCLCIVKPKEMTEKKSIEPDQSQSPQTESAIEQWPVQKSKQSVYSNLHKRKWYYIKKAVCIVFYSNFKRINIDQWACKPLIKKFKKVKSLQNL